MSSHGLRHTTPLSAGVHLPGFDGATGWLGSPPLTADGLRGRVVLVDFWTLTCINWLRTEPWVRAWASAYQDDGLVVVGVHTPEFSFEHDIARVRQARLARQIDYPITLDNGYRIWHAFDNHYWPAIYLADRQGVIRDHQFGEGRYEQSERVIQQLLGVERELVAVDASGVEAQADWDNLGSPETYLGEERRERMASSEELRLNEWALTGAWTTGRENVVLDQGGGSIACRFHARDVHLVLSGANGAPIPFRVRLDGGPPGHSHGIDTDEDGSGLLTDGRLYQLVRQHGRIRDRTLDVIFDEPGAEAYVFTFG